MAGCGSSPATSATASTATGSSGGTGSAGTTAPTASPSPDPGLARLAAAIKQFGSGYAFDATARLGSTVATEAKGRWIGGASQLVLTSGGRSVTYRAVGSKTWVQQGDGSWVATQAQVPDGDPLSSFAAPKAAKTLSSTAVQVTYDPKSLGLTGSDPVTVRITFGSAGQMTMTYTAKTQAGAATSTTVFSPTTDKSPILAPGATPKPTG